MKPIRHLLIACTLWAAALLPNANAQVPQIINYQGRISVGAVPFTGTGQFRFALVDGTGATSYWSNDATSTAGSQPTAAVALPVVNGLYVVPLGDTAIPNMTAVPATVFSNGDVRLRVWFDDGSNPVELLAPDQRITSVGYAMVAAVANQVKDQAVTTVMLADQSVTGGKIADNTITASKLAPGAVNSGTIADGTIDTPDLTPTVLASLVPPGTILPYGGTTAPAGYLLCNGSSYAKSLYPALAAVLYNNTSGSAFGGTTFNFNVPDLRGRFLRGVDGTPQRDPDRSSRTTMASGGNAQNAVGSVQNDAFQGHYHQLRTTGGDYMFPQGLIGGTGAGITFMDRNPNPVYDQGRAAAILTDGVNGTPRTSSETRPTNAYVNFIIKY